MNFLKRIAWKKFGSLNKPQQNRLIHVKFTLGTFIQYFIIQNLSSSKNCIFFSIIKIFILHLIFVLIEKKIEI